MLVSPVVPPYVPAGHWVHELVAAPPVLKDPVGQLPVHEALVRPGVEPYVPAGHCVQTDDVAPPIE